MSSAELTEGDPSGSDHNLNAPIRRAPGSPFTWTIAGLTIITFVLSLGFPLVSDDFCHLVSSSTRGLFGAASHSFRNWTARTGELLMLLGGRHLDGAVFDLLNALVMMGLAVVGFRLIYGRPGRTTLDALTVIALFVLVSLATPFGAVFLWRSGAVNYSWSLLLIAVHFLAFRLRDREPASSFDRLGPLAVAGFIVVSFLAGMGSFDLGALGVLIHAALLLRRRRSGRPLALRYELPALAYALGFTTLYLAPGTQARADQIPSHRSLGSIVESVFTGDLVEVLRHHLLLLGWAVDQTNYLVLVAAVATVALVARDRLQNDEGDVLRRSAFAAITVGGGFAAVAAGGGALDRYQTVGCVLLAVLAFAIANLTEPARTGSQGSDIEEQTPSIRVLLWLTVIVILDAAAFTVGIIPAQRAYLPAAALAAAIVVIAIRPLLARRPGAAVLLAALVLSLGAISVQVVGERTNAMRFDEAIELSVDRAVVVEPSSFWWDSPQFYDWVPLSASPTFWANGCVAAYHGLDSVRLSAPHRELGLSDFLDELQR
ncbi:MAG: DUF6056 family protein [Actinomycetota bacterium]